MKSYEEFYNKMGKIAYKKYCEFSDNKSLVSGTDLPAWHNLPQNIRDAWIYSSTSLLDVYDDIKEIKSNLTKLDNLI